MSSNDNNIILLYVRLSMLQQHDKVLRYVKYRMLLVVISMIIIFYLATSRAIIIALSSGKEVLN